MALGGSEQSLSRGPLFDVEMLTSSHVGRSGAYVQSRPPAPGALLFVDHPSVPAQAPEDLPMRFSAGGGLRASQEGAVGKGNYESC
jgi:hypothetical protein